MHNLFKGLDVTCFHAIKKPQLLPQSDVIIICYLVSYWFRRGLESLTANQSSFHLNARLPSDKETTVIALKKTNANTQLLYHVKSTLKITPCIIFVQHGAFTTD